MSNGLADEGDLVPIDHGPRLEKLRRELTETGLDALWVTKAVNVRWVCGFTGSNGQLLVRDECVLLISDGRYGSQASAELAAGGLGGLVEIATVSGQPESALSGRWVSELTTKRVGFESDDLTTQRYERLAAALPGAQLQAQPGLIDGLRQVKEPAERERLELAAKIADHALREQLEFLVPGITERTFAAELDHRMRLLGAEDVSFATIVASGENSAIPHHRPGERSFNRGDLVVVDFGAKVDGYGSDMTRTYVVGGDPSHDQTRLYEAVADAQAAGVGCIAEGVRLAEVDSVCRSVLEDRGYGEAFIHGTGHSLGLEIHEQPMLSSRSVGTLRTGLIVTVEPGAYLPGFGGVRVEDSVVVTSGGCQPITHAPKGLTP